MRNFTKNIINKLKTDLKSLEIEGPEKNPKIIKRDIMKLLLELLTWLGS
ncbi:hypothetical protein CPAST_c02000 [Clostridium pasteurianum DSM 525 = ATCC 6013]|uniref:Uncharacterized protein n=1 Tax=Clostridium pasteurianum DSM 525 = ATCC 6013 TaxID=1262449 RepID=A0A0H3J5U3_CLOPA|nr:hypothetical protein [Clostridium pasteurianum]AJA46300.1 hypothetical protein CPAST_c02000 [Clostridium pasteurianum DSM 525 = ATCC 6013]AJA50288.1 hypothetical protein CLPA_c02000 [Clostridium pasteurianum DSM 525 = ATCC 6013]KRU13699.1 hypothetical protein CP6013_02947 [Clostridium pasteurianum DSM 525 = ATCC 6013]